MMRVTAQEVEKHINATNPHHGARDAWQGMPVGWDRLYWFFGKFPIDELPEVSPASKKDVKRYAAHAKKWKKDFPAIVVIGKPPDSVVADGAHRLAAARLLGNTFIDAYWGI